MKLPRLLDTCGNDAGHDSKLEARVMPMELTQLDVEVPSSATNCCN